MTKATTSEVALLNANPLQAESVILTKLLTSPGEWHRVSVAEVAEEYRQQVLTEYQLEADAGSTDETPNPNPSVADMEDYLINQADYEDVLIWIRRAENPQADYIYARAIERW